MRYALYPGCVSRGACPELYAATLEVCSRLGIELDLDTMRGASCTGAGVLQEKNLRLADTLNARTFAMAERAELPILTICSTCQGVMSQANERLQDDEYRASINEELAEEGLDLQIGNNTGGDTSISLSGNVIDSLTEEAIELSIFGELGGKLALVVNGNDVTGEKEGIKLRVQPPESEPESEAPAAQDETAKVEGESS